MAKVVVIGRNYTSRLGMIRAVGRAGHQVYVIRTDRSRFDGLDKASRYVNSYYSAKEPDRDLLLTTLEKIANHENEKIVLIPVDDYAASTIDENIGRLKGNFLFPNVNMQQGAINKLMDKNYQKKLAREAGLIVAVGWAIDIKDHEYSLPENIKYPCFPKPQVSFMGDKRCMVKCSTEQELRKVLDGLASVRDCPVLIEQFIEIEKEYAALGFSNGQVVTIPAVIHLLNQGHGGHRGVTKLGELIQCSEFLPFLEKFTEFMKSLNFVGLFDVDMYESGGIIYFNELNLRFGASGYAITHQGVNLPDMLIKSLLGEELVEKKSDNIAFDVFVNEKVNFDDYLAGYYGWKEYRRIQRMAGFSFLSDKNDPKPYRQFKKLAFANILRKHVKNVFRKP